MKVAVKSSGRGRKPAEWVLRLYFNLMDEFERLSSAGMKFSPKLLRTIAKHELTVLQQNGEVAMENSKGTSLVSMVTELCNVSLGMDSAFHGEAQCCKSQAMWETTSQCCEANHH